MIKTNNRKLLAIGGPREFEWLDDYGYSDVVVAMPLPPRAFTSDSDPIVDLEPVKTARYRKEKLGDPRTHKIKEVYVVDSMSGNQAVIRLKDYLLEKFINMEDVTD